MRNRFRQSKFVARLARWEGGCLQGGYLGDHRSHHGGTHVCATLTLVSIIGWPGTLTCYVVAGLTYAGLRYKFSPTFRKFSGWNRLTRIHNGDVAESG